MWQLGIVIALIVMLSGSPCSARIPTAQCFLGDLTVGTSIAEAHRIYGKPVRTTVNGSIRKYIYGDGSFWFTAKDGNVLEINTEANNGIHTKDGISVGMSIQAMYNAYGKPDFVRNNSYHYVKDAGRVSSTELVFFIVNNKIVRIYLNCKI